MIVIRFPDDETERRGLGSLAGRFSFTTWKSGETIVPDKALSHLAVRGIPFIVVGPATYEQLVPPLRTSAATPVQ